MRRMPAFEQLRRMPRELRAVGGHGQLVEPVADSLAELGNELVDALAHQRLAAGQPDSLYAARDEESASSTISSRLSTSLRGRKVIFSAMQ